VRRDLPFGTVTFLFTDVEGSTKLLHDLGAAAYAEALAEHRALLRQAFSAHEGVEVDTQGDAFFVAFQTAADAAAAAREALAALASGPIRVRVGIQTGTAHLTEGRYVGEDVHKGARIAAAGHGGQVLLSQTTRELVGDEVTDLGEHRLKDFAEPVSIFQLGSERFPPLKTISNTNLPRPASSFVGRERELGEVTSLLEDGARLLTLTGPGGSGKTRLALEAAAELVPQFKAGVFWVPLAPLREPALVTETIAQTLGAKDGLGDHIGERELLLLLDNLEQVVEVAPELAVLVEACPNLCLLVTSRERLRVRGEVEYPVLPLAEPEAVELFCARAPLQPDELVAELCRRLDNLPLAVELAAARTSVLSPAQILERLSQRLDLLKGGRDAEARQQTLRAAIEWSYDLLSPEEQRLFRRLSVFAGGCILEAAEQVAEADLDTLQSLVDKSLLRRAEERFWMLETIREFALERLKASTEADDVASRHAARVLALGRGDSAGAHRGSGLMWTDSHVSDLANLRAAIAWCFSAGDRQRCLELALTAGSFRPSALEWYAWLERALAGGGDLPPRLRAEASATAGHLAQEVLKDSDAATAHFDASAQLFAAIGDDVALANVLTGSGHALLAQGKLDEAQATYEHSMETFRKAGSARGVYYALHQLGEVELARGNFSKAADLLEESARLARDAGDDQNLITTVHGLGDTRLEQGYLVQARAAYTEGLAVSRNVGSSLGIAHCAAGLAAVAAEIGETERSGRMWACVETVTATSDISLWEADRYRSRVDRCRKADEVTFAAAFADACATALESVLDEAFHIPGAASRRTGG
jgi:predicted ATPase